MQQQLPPQQASAVGGLVGSSFAEMSSFFERMEAKAKADRAEMEAKLEAKDAKMEAKIAELTAPAPAAISDGQVAALQARIEALNAAKLLSDEVRAPQFAMHCHRTHTLVSSKLTCALHARHITTYAGAVCFGRPSG